MVRPCRRIRYRKKRRDEPVVKVENAFPCPYDRSRTTVSDDAFRFYDFEGETDELPATELAVEHVSNIDAFRKWLQGQRFLPQDVSNEFLAFFLTASEYCLQLAEESYTRYFYARQEPSVLFRDRDPLSPANQKILNKLYAIPMPDTTADGTKVIITGLVEPIAQYNQVDHLKILAMVIDLIIWEKDFGFGDFVIILDGSGFQCPQLLGNRAPNHKEMKSLLLDTIPGTLRAIYLLYPPLHVANVASTRNNIWLRVIRSKQEMIKHVPANCLPLEYGGSLGHVGDLIDQWAQHLKESRDFFVHFEKRMIFDYNRRLCQEKEMREGGPNWVQNMKLEADEWEYKIKYYERMRTMKPFTHPGFGSERVNRVTPSPPTRNKTVICLENAKEEEEKLRMWEPPKLYNGYAKEIRKAKLEAERLEREERERNELCFIICIL